MAPEIITTSKYDEKCDIYSLGIVIYEMYYLTKQYNKLTNEQLYIGLNKSDIKNTITDKFMKLPQEFQELTKFMLISDPNLRITAQMAKNFPIFNKDFDNSLQDVAIIDSQKQYQK